MADGHKDEDAHAHQRHGRDENHPGGPALRDDGTYDWDGMWAESTGDCHDADRLVLATIAKLPEVGSALDVGCGAGSLLLELAAKGWQVSGLDIAKNAIEKARRALSARGIEAELFVGNAASWSPPATYDLVTNCFALPQSKEEQQRALTMMQRAVASGGTLVIKDFDSRMARFDHFEGFHMPTLEELTAPLTELEVLRAEVVGTPVHNAAQAERGQEKWTAGFVVARRNR